MFIDDQTIGRGNKTYRRVLLRNSYRVNGKVRHDTIANLSKCSDEEIEALKWALKNKHRIHELGPLSDNLKIRQGRSVGSVWVLYRLAKRLGIVDALGSGREAQLALLMIISSVIGHNSRLSIVRNANNFAYCDILGIDKPFDEDDLYQAMDWLADRQDDVEQKLFRHRYKNSVPTLYLYDVTSSYLEGELNELAAYGYNRDKKKGKKQIVIGLLTDEQGVPLSVEVFRGNTADTRTFAQQIEKIRDRFGAVRVVMVGDRGMIKSMQIDELNRNKFNYITAITKSQIEGMLKKGVFQMDMFDEELTEVEHEGIRYILKRNPCRAAEISKNRESKIKVVARLAEEQNVYLQKHSRARTDVAVRKVENKINKLKLHKWFSVSSNGRTLKLQIDETGMLEDSRLDGCYTIKTDLKPEEASAEIAHARYKDLANVEQGFRTMKSKFLELRGIFVRKEARTRAHVFVVMLAYLLSYHLYEYWKELEVTVEEGVNELSSICAIMVSYQEKAEFQSIPEPRTLGRALLDAAGFTLPEVLPGKDITVATRKKLVEERKIANSA